MSPCPMKMRVTEADVFILTAGAVDVDGSCRLLYWCIGPEGPALIRIGDHKPLFFVARDSMEGSGRGEGNRFERRKLSLITLEGVPVDGLYFRTLADYRETRRRLGEQGIRTWEADVRPEDRFLMERFISGSARITGICHNQGGFRGFRQPGTLSLPVAPPAHHHVPGH